MEVRPEKTLRQSYLVLGIGFVVGIRFIVYFVPILVVLSIYWYYYFGNDDIISTTFVEVAVFGAWAVAFYLRIAKHMRDTAKV